VRLKEVAALRTNGPDKSADVTPMRAAE